ncbi:hypothetical protein [Pseudarthrobacter chlorophenolicus]|uniref:hypothetical protein n=1 Tax=Pseudarthrobacter chlorophenolicus TaxID=85085 RepID=UPI00142ED685|nr:hypothetical protein [Pseudarthrobacter chlorophenolicus]
MTLAPARRPELEGWPATLPEPAVSFRVDDFGQIITTATDPSGDWIDVWEKDDGSGGYGGHALGEWEGADDDDIEQAQNWLTGRHKVIVAAVREAEKAAVEQARSGILAAAVGETKPATEPDPTSAEERPCTDGPWCAAPRGKHVDGCEMGSF